MPKGGFEKPISSTDINRPALMLTGFSEHFDNLRIQLFGKVEMAYLETLTAPARREAIHRVFAQNVPLVIIARGNRPFPEMREFAEEFGVPLAVSEESTSFIISSLNAYLNKQLCPRITIHGVLVEVYGVGVLLRGDSGIGKSETAIELIKRGHSLVADDAVEIKRVSNITLLGSAPPVIRHFIELRGIGVVDVHNLFGISAVKEVSKIDLVIELEQWVENKHYDRMGLENYTTEILGLNIPMLTVPVRPGRNLAVVVEVAAMNQQQKGLGYNAAKELNERIMGNLEI
ncbi:MAG: HPr(Ser) kinase/phosphatase [Clostridia bacterium]|nr:HPr(Ser) kinase/phosphatase [Clostridia bacterium]